jgi:hypothetical protein
MYAHSHANSLIESVHVCMLQAGRSQDRDPHEVNEFFLSVYVIFQAALGPRGRTRGSVVVKALWYKPEGRGFDTR